MSTTDDVEITWEDPVGDPHLTCTRCGEDLCSVEVGDTVRVLVAVVIDHAAACVPASIWEYQADGSRTRA